MPPNANEWQAAQAMRLVDSFGSGWLKGGSGALKHMSPSTHLWRAIEKQGYAADSHGGSFTQTTHRQTTGEDRNDASR